LPFGCLPAGLPRSNLKALWEISSSAARSTAVRERILLVSLTCDRNLENLLDIFLMIRAGNFRLRNRHNLIFYACYTTFLQCHAAAPPHSRVFLLCPGEHYPQQAIRHKILLSTLGLCSVYLSAQGVGLMQHFRADFDVIFVTGGMGS